MRIIYVSTVCDANLFNRIQKSGQRPSVAEQKFHYSLLNGLQEWAEIDVISSMPLLQGNLATKIAASVSADKIGELTPIYLIFFPFLGLKHAVVAMDLVRQLFKIYIHSAAGPKVILCHLLNPSISVPSFVFGKILRIPVVTIVPDLPVYIRNSSLSTFKASVVKSLIGLFQARFDGYIVLTEQLNKAVNENQRPWLLMEGVVSCMATQVQPQIMSTDLRVIMYAGSLDEKFGIKLLVEGFLKLKYGNSVQLWIYGGGDSAAYIEEVSRRVSTVRYFGFVPAEEVSRAQQFATVLVNPRPSSDEFSKYSFPSKIMEYMASGVPLLTTRLASIPHDYFPYLYFVDNESPDGFAVALASIIDCPCNQLHVKGQLARSYVLECKSGRMQSRRIINFLTSNFIS